MKEKLQKKTVKIVVIIVSIIGKESLKKNGVSTWKIKIKNIEGSDIMIGVALKNIDLNSQNNYWKGKAWSFFYNNGNKILNQSYQNYANCRINNNDIIKIIYDTQNITLAFKINNINYGVVYDNLTLSELFPFVEMCYNNDEIEFLD